MEQNPFVEQYMAAARTTKDDVLQEIESIRFTYDERGKYDKERPAAYYHNIGKLLSGLQFQVRAAVLPEPLPRLWSYSVVVDLYGARLLLMHAREDSLFIDASDPNEKVVTLQYDATYIMLQMKSMLFTVEEYADSYGVNVGTVRQWIRRGKIRTAIKEGNEWRIPELTPPPTRGYKTGSYVCQDLEKVPQEFSYIQGFNYITICQDEKSKGMFRVIMQKNSSDNENLIKEEKVITEEQRGKLEVFLIGNNDVLYTGEL